MFIDVGFDCGCGNLPEFWRGRLDRNECVAHEYASCSVRLLVYKVRRKICHSLGAACCKPCLCDAIAARDNGGRFEMASGRSVQRKAIRCILREGDGTATQRHIVAVDQRDVHIDGFIRAGNLFCGGDFNIGRRVLVPVVANCHRDIRVALIHLELTDGLKEGTKFGSGGPPGVHGIAGCGVPLLRGGDDSREVPCLQFNLHNVRTVCPAHTPGEEIIRGHDWTIQDGRLGVLIPEDDTPRAGSTGSLQQSPVKKYVTAFHRIVVLRIIPHPPRCKEMQTPVSNE